MEPVPKIDEHVSPSFAELLRQLINDVTAYIDAERNVYGVQIRHTRRATGSAALFALGAIVLAQGAMIALVVGVLLTLIPLIGAAWATFAVVVTCAGLAVIFVALIRIKFGSIIAAWGRRHAG